MPEVYEGIDLKISNIIKEKQIPQRIYYYTTIDAMYNIFCNNELWLGNTSSMNDKKEMTEFIDNLQDKLCKHFLYDEKMVEKIKEDIFDDLQKIYPYAMCFSKYSDNAAQWERYANNAKGVCLQFESFELIKLLYYSQGYISAISYGYSPDNHEIYQEIIDCITDKVIKWGSKEQHIKQIKKTILLIANMRKHISFETEGEIRYSTLWNRTLEYSRIEYKLLNGTIREIMVLDLKPYLCKNNMKINDIISKIIIGPRASQTIGELGSFVNSIDDNYVNIEIVKSECPLR